MKRSGLVILVIGFALALFSGVTSMTREEAFAAGPINLMSEKEYVLDFSPFLGLVIMAIGAIVYLLGLKSDQL